MVSRHRSVCPAAVQYKPQEETPLPPADYSKSQYTEYPLASMRQQAGDNARHIAELRTHYNMLHSQDRRTILRLSVSIVVLVVFLASWLILIFSTRKSAGSPAKEALMNCIKCQKPIPQDGLYCPYCGKKQQAEKKKRKKRANGMGTVCRKPGSRSKPWEAQKAGIYVGAYATKYEAEQALLRLADLPISETLNMTFEQVYKRWFPEHTRTITAKGAEGYTTAYKHCESIYPRIFRKLRTGDFQQVIMDMEEKGLSNASCAKVLQLFGQMSDWAIREEICHTNYSRFVQLTPQQKKEKQVFTAEQIAMFQKSTLPAAKIALILIATGCRPNELFSVPLSACFDSYFISGSKTEAGRNRIIPVSALGLPAYRALLETATQKGCRKLIDAYSGNHTYPNFAKRDWKDLMSALNIDNMTPYSCRHTFTTLAVKSGVKPEILQRILGHTNYDTTATIYTHLNKADILEEVKKLTVTDTLQTPKIDP